VGTAPALNALDEQCKQHDAAYATGGDLKLADETFYLNARNLGTAGWVMGNIVGLQSLFRSYDKLQQLQPTNKQQPTNNHSIMPNLRGRQPNSKSNGKKESIMQTLAPTSIGSTIRAGKPQITRSTDAANIVGHDFIGTVEANGVSTFGLGKCALLSPAYFSSSMLGATAATFEKYRWNKLRIHYIPRVATTSTGQVIMTSQRSAAEASIVPESGTFLQRAMTQGNATFGPLWVPNYIDIDSKDWHLVDPAIHDDLDDAIAEVLLVYTQAASSGQVGYLWAEYDISFKGALYQPHHTLLPIATGPGVRAVFTDANAVNPTTEDVQLTNPDGVIFNLSSTFQGNLSLHFRPSRK